MTKVEGEGLIKTIQAWIDGRPMQRRGWPTDIWQDSTNVFESWLVTDVRIKPRLVSRPWTTAECPLGTVVRLPKNNDAAYRTIDTKTADGFVFLSRDPQPISLSYLHEHYQTEQGCVCGTLLDDIF